MNDKITITEGLSLSDETFNEWWALIEEDTKSEFNDLYLGDPILARFVCAADHLIRHKVESTHTGMCQLAYSLAAKVPLDSPHIQALANTTWEHVAVQYLSEKIRHRTLQQRLVKIDNNQVEIIERLQKRILDRLEDAAALTEEDFKSFNGALNAASKYKQVFTVEHVQQRADREKKALEKARAANASNQEMGKRELLALMKANIEVLPAKIRAVIAQDE